jgi:hypothetical protein
MSPAFLPLPLALIKDAAGALDGAWVARFAQALGLRAFIETGTYLGQSLENVRPAFERLVSIELSQELYEAACRRFATVPEVTLLQGDSAQRLGDARALCAARPTLYWLDAHWSAGNTARGEENTPILQELAVIAGHASAHDVVLIDDIRYFVSLPAGFATHESNAGYPQIEEVLAVLARFPAGGFQALLLGDVLVCAAPERMELLRASPLVKAITALRTERGMTADRRHSCEQRVAQAGGGEREAILALPEHYVNSLQYGIGGEFCYWRGLVREAAQDAAGAQADFELARRCGIPVPRRAGEVRA